MIAPIRDTPTTDGRRAAQRRKARRWIVESLFSRPEVMPRTQRPTSWAQWTSAGWIVLVAVVYLFAMLGGYFGRGS